MIEGGVNDEHFQESFEKRRNDLDKFKFIKIGFWDSLMVYLHSFLPVTEVQFSHGDNVHKKRCCTTNKILRLYEKGTARLEKEMDIVHTLKNLRNIKIYVKNQDPMLYLASKYEDFNFIDLD